MSRLDESGANLQCTNASILLKPATCKSFVCTCSRRSQEEMHAWYIAGVRYSIKESRCALYNCSNCESVALCRPDNSSEFPSRFFRQVQHCVRHQQFAINGTPSNLKGSPCGSSRDKICLDSFPAPNVTWLARPQLYKFVWH